MVLQVSGFSLGRFRVSDAKDKKRLLRAIQRTRPHIALRTSLGAIGLSRTRCHEWNNGERCELNDRPSCPRTLPHQLTKDEVNTIRASRSNEIWHVDTTVIRLLDGSRAYLHVIIDNFSRRILAWNVADSFQPATTSHLLKSATESMTASAKPVVLVDGGVENFNSAVDEVVESGNLKRILAQTEITFSNSLIESWWRTGNSGQALVCVLSLLYSHRVAAVPVHPCPTTGTRARKSRML